MAKGKIDVGTGMLLVLGLPCVGCVVWFAWLFARGDCLRILPFGAHTPPICGGGLPALAGICRRRARGYQRGQ